MDNNTYLFSSSSYAQQSALMTAGVSGNPNLAAGLFLGYFFLGLTIYIWAFWSQRSRLKSFKESITWSTSQYSRLKGVQRIYNMILNQLFIDLLIAIMTVLIGINFATKICDSKGLYNCAVVFAVWSFFRYYGLILNLFNALACLFFLCNPQSVNILRLVYIVLTILMSVFVPVYIYLNVLGIFGLSAVIIGLALAIIAKFTASTMSTMSPSATARKKPIMFVAMFTFLVVFAPSFILECLWISAANQREPTAQYLTIYVNVLLFTNVQLAMNGLLCYFVLKLPSEEEEQQQQQQERQQSFENSNNDNPANVIT